MKGVQRARFFHNRKDPEETYLPGDDFLYRLSDGAPRCGLLDLSGWGACDGDMPGIAEVSDVDPARVKYLWFQDVEPNTCRSRCPYEEFLAGRSKPQSKGTSGGGGCTWLRRCKAPALRALCSVPGRQ